MCQKPVKLVPSVVVSFRGFLKQLASLVGHIGYCQGYKFISETTVVYSFRPFDCVYISASLHHTHFDFWIEGKTI